MNLKISSFNAFLIACSFMNIHETGVAAAEVDNAAPVPNDNLPFDIDNIIDQEGEEFQGSRMVLDLPEEQEETTVEEDAEEPSIPINEDDSTLTKDLPETGENHSITISSVRAKSDIKPEIKDNGTAVYTLTHKDASYISVHFKTFEVPPGCNVIVSDPKGDNKQSYVDKKNLDLDDFWSQPVYGDTLQLRFRCKGVASPFRKDAVFEVDEYVAGFPGAMDSGDDSNRSVCGRDDRRNAICYRSSPSGVYYRARAVARIWYNGRPICTGWLASTKHRLITNNHCLSSSYAVSRSWFEFLAEETSCFTNSNRYGRFYTGSALLRTSSSLDYSIIQLRGTPAYSFGWLPIDTRSRASNGEPIYIPQHPGGRPKEIAVADSSTYGGVCRVYYDSAGRPRYLCDTEGGASGSPVLSRYTHRVVGLHAYGCSSCRCYNGGYPMYRIYREAYRSIYY